MGKIKKALITGITGQDGSYLAEFLLKKKYKVYGLVRRVALEDESHRLWRIKHLLNKIELKSASLESYASIVKTISKILLAKNLNLKKNKLLLVAIKFLLKSSKIVLTSLQQLFKPCPPTG